MDNDFVLKCARAQLARRIYLHIRLETLLSIDRDDLDMHLLYSQMSAPRGAAMDKARLFGGQLEIIDDF